MKTKNKKLQLKVIKETEGNPNVMEDDVFAGLVGSMRKKGWYFEPATVWEYEKDKYRAISGHKRIQAAIQAGIIDATFRVICDPEYTEAQARLDLLEANHRQGKDDEELAKRFIESMIDDLDIDIDKIVESTGIDDVEIENILNFMEELEDNEEDNEVPEVKKTNIKLGDIFQLGNHRIMCGDSTKIEDVEKLMGGVKADMVYTDPPYGILFNYKNYKDVEGQEYLKFCDKWFSFCCEISDFVFLTAGWKYNNYWINKNPSDIFYWLSPNKQTGGKMSYFRKVEPIFIFGDIEGKYNLDIFNYNSDRDDGLLENHPCPKPVRFIEEVISITKKNSVVADVFLGSGSTLIACEKTNRKCYGMEIEPFYVQTTIDRWELFTGGTAEKISNGSI